MSKSDKLDPEGQLAKDKIDLGKQLESLITDQSTRGELLKAIKDIQNIYRADSISSEAINQLKSHVASCKTALTTAVDKLNWKQFSKLEDIVKAQFNDIGTTKIKEPSMEEMISYPINRFFADEQEMERGERLAERQTKQSAAAQSVASLSATDKQSLDGIKQDMRGLVTGADRSTTPAPRAMGKDKDQSRER